MSKTVIFSSRKKNFWAEAEIFPKLFFLTIIDAMRIIIDQLALCQKKKIIKNKKISESQE